MPIQGGIPETGFPTGGVRRSRHQCRIGYRKVAGQRAVVWSGTEFSADNAWNLNADNGNQNNNDKDNQNHGWAVRPGE